MDDRDEPLSYRFSLITTVLGLIVIFGMPIAFGVMPWAAMLYFGIMMLVLMVMGQARDQRLLVILPFVQSRAIGDFLLSESSLCSTTGNYTLL